MAVDKNTAVINYLLTCPAIAENPVFFNFIQAQDGTKDIVTIANDKIIQRPYIDGSVQKRYMFTIQDFRSISPNPLAFMPGEPPVLYNNENVEDMLDVQGIIDWIETQDSIHTYPDFGSDCIIEKISTTTDNPNLNGIDNNVSPALAKYSITVQIDYIDNTNVIF